MKSKLEEKSRRESGKQKEIKICRIYPEEGKKVDVFGRPFWSPAVFSVKSILKTPLMREQQGSNRFKLSGEGTRREKQKLSSEGDKGSIGTE